MSILARVADERAVDYLLHLDPQERLLVLESCRHRHGGTLASPPRIANLVASSKRRSSIFRSSASRLTGY